MPRQSLSLLLTTLLMGMLLSACGQPMGTRQARQDSAEAAPQEKQCMAKGWQRVAVQISGVPRELLWKAPSGPWLKGTIIVLHGGGGQHFQWCVANAPLVAPQVRFSESAVAEGFAVFLLNSSDLVTDNEGRVCGKVWDDEVRNRPNLDLPFIGTVVHELLPQLRPSNSRGAVFITGLSSGGYMTVRAATHFNNLLAAFAPASSGDPYGWHRVCEAGATPRTSVHGAGFDNETGKQITEPDACRSEAYSHGKPWGGATPNNKPAFRIFGTKRTGSTINLAAKRSASSCASTDTVACRTSCCGVDKGASPIISGSTHTAAPSWTSFPVN